jgi:hypothetical protein
VARVDFLYEELGITGESQPEQEALAAAAPPRPRSFDELVAATPPPAADPPPDEAGAGLRTRSGVPELPAGIPDPLSLDVESSRESLLTGLAIACLILAFVFFALGTDNHKRGRHRPAIWPEAFYLIPFPLGLAALFGALRAGTRDEHLLRLGRRTLSFKTSFFERGTERVVFRAGEVERIFLGEHKKSSKHSSWMEYSIVAVDHSGDSLTIAKSERDLLEVTRRAQAVAAILGAKYQAGII